MRTPDHQGHDAQGLDSLRKRVGGKGGKERDRERNSDRERQTEGKVSCSDLEHRQTEADRFCGAA